MERIELDSQGEPCVNDSQRPGSSETQGQESNDQSAHASIQMPVSSTAFLLETSSFPNNSLYREHLLGFEIVKSRLSNVTLTRGLASTLIREDIMSLLPDTLIGIFPKTVTSTSNNSKVLLRAGSIVAAKTVRFSANGAFSNALGWGQGGVAAVLLKDLEDGDISALVREQDDSDGRLTFSGVANEVLVRSIRQVEWHNVRRGNLNCYQGITWGCEGLNQPLVLTWVANKRGNIDDDESSSMLAQTRNGSPLFATESIREFVERMPKPIGHFDTIMIPLNQMAKWMTPEQIAAAETQTENNFEVMIVHIIPDRLFKKPTIVMVTNWSQVFDMRDATNYEAIFLRNLVCLPHGPFENELYDLGATILEIDATEHPVAHFLFLEAYRLHYKIARFDIMSEDEKKPPRYSRATAIELWVHPELAQPVPYHVPSSLLTSPRRRFGVPGTTSSSSTPANSTPVSLVSSRGQGDQGRGGSDRSSHSSSNHGAVRNSPFVDAEMAREVAEKLRKKIDGFQSRAEKLRAENAGLREVQKTLEKDRKSDQKKIDTLNKRVGSAEEVDKASALIPATLKKVEDALSGQRTSLAQATKQLTADLTKTNNSTADIVKSLTASMTSVGSLVSNLVSRMDQLEDAVGSGAKGDEESNERGRDGSERSKKHALLKTGRKRSSNENHKHSSSSSESSSPVTPRKSRHDSKGTIGKKSVPLHKSKKYHKKRIVLSDSGSCSSDCVVHEDGSSESGGDKVGSSKKGSKKRRSLK